MKLILINGPCGVGKTTVAKQICDQIPLSFYLDGDAQTRFISHYKEHDKERRNIFRAVLFGIIEACLKINRDVVVDKIIMQAEILDACYEIAKKYGAESYEIVLWASKDIVMSRANARGWPKDNLLTQEKCELFWGEIDRLKTERPSAHVIDIEDLSEADVLQKVKSIVF